MTKQIRTICEWNFTFELQSTAARFRVLLFNVATLVMFKSSSWRLKLRRGDFMQAVTILDFLIKILIAP